MIRRDPAAEAAAMERRILLAIALNATRTMSCAELMAAAAVARRPEDEAPIFECALYALRARGIVQFRVLVASGCQVPVIHVTDDAALPTATAAILRRRMGAHPRVEGEDACRLRRVLILPGPQLADTAPCYLAHQPPSQ